MSRFRELLMLSGSTPPPPPPEETWEEVERVMFDGNTYVETEDYIRLNGVIQSAWQFPTYASFSDTRYFCGVTTSATSSTNRWFTLQRTFASSNHRFSSYRGTGVANAIVSNTMYRANEPIYMTRTATDFIGTQKVDGIDTTVFMETVSGSNVASTLNFFIGAVNYNGNPRSGLANYYFYKITQTNNAGTTTYFNIVPVVSNLGNYALYDKVGDVILKPKKIDESLDYGGVLYPEPPVTLMKSVSLPRGDDNEIYG